MWLFKKYLFFHIAVKKAGKIEKAEIFRESIEMGNTFGTQF